MRTAIAPVTDAATIAPATMALALLGGIICLTVAAGAQFPYRVRAAAVTALAFLAALAVPFLKR